MPLTHFVNMIPTKVPGMNNHLNAAFLLPVGSACEDIRGISHLFEHLLIGTLINHLVYTSGYTTEDYIICFCSHISPPEVVKIIEDIKVNKNEIRINIKKLIEEIKTERLKDEELFFQKVWRNTKYQKTPLGSIQDIKKITIGNVVNFRKRILQKALYFYDPDSGINVFNHAIKEEVNTPGFKIISMLEIRHKEKFYDVFYIKGEMEAFFLLEKILKIRNPGKHIQISEKKEMSSIIIEKGSKLPEMNEIDKLSEDAFVYIENEINDIKNNFVERALNELESIYFYNKSWIDRVNTLFKTKKSRISGIITELRRMKGVP